MTTTFDNNSTGFGTQFDNMENPLNSFCKKYRANVCQTKIEQINLPYASVAVQDLAEASVLHQRRHPTVEIRMSNDHLEDLMEDWHTLEQMQRFIRSDPQVMESYLKWQTWEGLNKR